jgi:hypothetical protein
MEQVQTARPTRLQRSAGADRDREGAVVAGTSQPARRWVWATALLSGAVFVALVVVAIFANLDTADRLASIAGASLGALGLVITVLQLARSSDDVPVTGARSVQAGGSIGRAVTGDRNRLRGSVRTPSPPLSMSPGAANPGVRGVSAAGAIGEAVTGDGNDES